MSGQTLLSALCSICNINESKYRCPGCAARTCSLPCYKRHQQWAQCSGQRDPTKFVKKSELVTPAGIDHDFNFLSGIERDLERAERTVSATDISTPPHPKSRGQQGGTNYSRLEASGVKVIRAPRGLSRQKENQSHPSSTKKAKHNIVWTVEWFDVTQQRILTQTSSTSQIGNADPFTEHKSKKRKLGDDTPPSTDSKQHRHGTNTAANQIKSIDFVEVDSKLQRDTHKSQQFPLGKQQISSETREQDDRTTKGEADVADPHLRRLRDDGPATQSMGPERRRYFLLRPRTSSSRQVLIPLDSSQTFAQSLAGRTILEFPTIYAFPSSMADLPDQYMLEEAYIQQEGEEQKEFDEMLQELDPEILKRLREDGSSRRQDREEELDSSRILDVLKQDLGGVV